MSNNRQMNYIGRVLDREKQAPISGAKVSLNFSGAPPIVYTDLEGIFRFPVKFDGSGIQDGQIRIQADGYRTYDSSVKLSSSNRDIGDISLVNPRTSQTQNENQMLLMVIVSMAIAIGIFFTILTKSAHHSAPEDEPLRIHNNTLNFDQPSNALINHSFVIS